MGGLSRPQPLAATHDREAFDCGRATLNTWFQRHAWQNQRNDSSRTSVIIQTETGRIAGYVSLSSGQIEREYLPKAAQRNRPDPVPVILLGQLAVDLQCQGQGCGRSLLIYALKTALRYSREIGCAGVLTQPIDDDARHFYEAFNFEPLEGDPKHRMIIRIVDIDETGLDQSA